MKSIRIILFFLFSTNINANGIILGYITGNEYLKMDSQSQNIWIIGVMDGIMAESLLIKKDDKGPWLGRCIDGLDTDQIKAIFEKKLKEKPEEWHTPAALTFRSKLHAFCKGRI